MIYDAQGRVANPPISDVTLKALNRSLAESIAESLSHDTEIWREMRGHTLYDHRGDPIYRQMPISDTVQIKMPVRFNAQVS